MSLRLALYEWTARHGLDAASAQRLQALAGLNDEPEALQRAWPRGLAVLGAALGGFGLVMWIAAHWGDLGRHGRFALLMAFVAVMGAGAAWRPAARAPLGLLAFLGIGALFAHFGQTYQTGADPWQLFALWAALSLPLCLGARSDVLWAPWALVVAVAISLWTHARLGQRWEVPADDLATHAVAGGAAVLLVLGLGRGLSPITGAGVWALRTAVTLTVVMLTLIALGGLFHSPVAPHFALGLALLAVGAALLSRGRGFDIYALSAVALGVDTLLTAGLARLLFSDSQGSEIASLFFIGIVAAGLLAGSVTLILRLSRQHGAPEAAHA